MHFDHLRLSGEHRRLIEEISPSNADTVFLEPLDKGLSGSAVWLAQWSLSNGTRTSLSVLKINTRKKIEHEKHAFDQIVSRLDNQVGVFTFHFSGSNEEAPSILNQPFKGNQKTFAVKNLRERILKSNDATEPQSIIDALYQDRMSFWHPETERRVFYEITFRAAFDWWVSKYDLPTIIAEMGSDAIEDDFDRYYGLRRADVFSEIEKILNQTEKFCYGPIHGDLHAQNILFDQDNRIHLIDFGWTAERWKAIDFLMLECSLKFLVAPHGARQKDLLEIEKFLDGDVSIETFKKSLYPSQISHIASAIARIREICLQLKYADLASYRKGLAVLTACLASYPGLNRRFLLNSLCYQLRSLKS